MAGMFAKVPGTLYRKAYGVAWNRQEIRKLAKDRHPAAREVSQAVLAVLADDFAPEERAAFVRVEALRTSLSDSQEQITLVDYGAGTETETRSPEEMSHGRTATTTIGAICRTNSKPPPWARLLFALIRKLEPRQCLELGTSLGLSAAVTTGRFQDTLAPLLQERPEIDFAFVDGHHDRDATIAYFEQLMAHFNPTGVLVFDDVAWSPGMAEAWRLIRSDERVGLAVDMFKVGVCVLGSGPVSTYRIALD